MKCIRTCIACRRKANKYELFRIVSDKGEAKLDTNMNINARGIYICNNAECIKKSLKMKNINKVVKIDVKVDSLKRLLIEMEDM